ncbi:hypothetical protein ILUMI_08373 [Ignelater luminosus]|uniref:Replication factor A protein 3 n=1 Tax=Ignelater luminosus TaxID=2038154 RepID=A0A8K0D6C7_IGNLU|nr:hypothetical protein ILUMI_08373 [Ignelater luminosus]
MSENLREIVTGDMLPGYNGKKVSVTGLVTHINPNGLTFDIRTVDDVLVKVNLRKPNRDPLEGYVEVHGTAQAGNVVICDNIVQFSSKTDEFDAAGHNSLCKLLHSVPNLYKTTS